MAATPNHDPPLPGGFTPTFHWRILGTPAPVFPGFEIDVCDRIPEAEEADAAWHRNRAREILRRHPEVSQLTGRAPVTAVFCLAGIALQIGIAISMTTQPWWVILLVANLFGGVLNILLFTLAHECNHFLVFKSEPANRWLFTLTSLPMMFAGHHSWWIEHHVHHNHLGSRIDFIKRRRSILLAMKDRIFNRVPGPRVQRMTSWLTTPLFWPIAALMLVTQFLRSIVGLAVYGWNAVRTGNLKPNDFALAILADEHLVSGYHRYKLEAWAVVYPLMSLGLVVGIWLLFGWIPLAYLFLSALFATGFLQPLVFGMILSNSHFHGHDCYQPSASNYGVLNWFTFNFGLHTEHHDFHKIPWLRLGRLRKIAPEFYENLKQTPSFIGLALRFAFGTRDSFDNEDYRNAEMLKADSPHRLTPSRAERDRENGDSDFPS